MYVIAVSRVFKDDDDVDEEEEDNVDHDQDHDDDDDDGDDDDDDDEIDNEQASCIYEKRDSELQTPHISGN